LFWWLGFDGGWVLFGVVVAVVGVGSLGFGFCLGVVGFSVGVSWL